MRLQLDRSVVMADIWNVSFSPGGKLLAIADRAAGTILVIDAASGRQIHAFRADLWLTDSLVGRLETDSMWRGRLIPRAAWNNPDGSPVRLTDQRRLLTNTYENCVFTSDSTIAIAGTALCVTVDHRLRRILHGHTVLVHHRIGGPVTSVEAVGFTGSPFFPQAVTIAGGDEPGTLVLSAIRTDVRDDLPADSLLSLSIVGSDGRRLRDLGAIPEEFRASGLGYDLLESFPLFIAPDRRYVLHSAVPAIENIATGRVIALDGLPGDNGTFFREVGAHRGRPLDSSIALMTIRCLGLYRSSGGGFVVPVLHSPNGTTGERWMIREMGSDGTLRRTVTVPRRIADKVVKFVAVNPHTLEIALFAVDDAGGWRVYSYRAI